MKKIHFQLDGDIAACGRPPGRLTLHVGNVSCLACKKRPAFINAKASIDAQRKAAFEAQVPREVKEPWRDGIITCRGAVQGPLDGIPIVPCGGTLFREGDRTCYGHYANYVCAACGHTESRLTETGMSF